jgi:hypothetical protein
MNKSLKEFLELLHVLTLANIDFLEGKQPYSIELGKYCIEITKIQDVINSFDFVKNQGKDNHETTKQIRPTPRQPLLG